MVSQPNLASRLGIQPPQATSGTTLAVKDEAPAFTTPEEQKVARTVYEVIRKLETSRKRCRR